MKKLLLALTALLVLAVGAIYYFIPGTLTVAEAVKVNCNNQAAFRAISNDLTLSKWGASAGDSVAADGNKYTITKKMINGFDILVERNKKQYQGNMLLIPVKKDSTIIKWELNLQASSSPLQRITDYRTALSLKKNMEGVLSNMQNYLSLFENAYGFRLEESSITDTLFISTKAISRNYPPTDFVYELINKLKDFCKTQGCTVTGSPMLNITRMDSAQYQVRTALPVNRLVPGNGDVSTGKMVRGKFIVTEVTGGRYKVEERLQQINYYFRDYGRMSMAIPFTYLITDRQQETDTSKWVTRIFAPVY